MRTPNTRWGWIFLTIVVVQAIVVLALEGYVFRLFEDALLDKADVSPYGRTVPTYLGIFIFGLIYQIVLTWDGLVHVNTIQIIGLCMYNLGLMIYSALQSDQIDLNVEQLRYIGWDFAKDRRHTIKPLLVAVPCVLGLGTALLSFVAWQLHGEFAWAIYKNISADLRMTRRFLGYQIYIALLKFDFFFFLGFTVQFLVIVKNDPTSVEFALTTAVIPLTIIALIVATIVVKRENRPGMIVIIIIYLCGLAYFIFKLARMYSPARAELYKPARKSMTTFAVITVILLVITVANAIYCMVNFDKGLKPYLRRNRDIPKEVDNSSQTYSMNPQAPYGQGHRLMIE